MTTVDTIVQAIEEKKSVAFGYHGFDRVVSPYACGINASNEIKLIGLQTEGGSNSGVVRKLRWYSIVDMLGLEIHEAAPYEEPDELAEKTVAQLIKTYARF